MTIGEFWNQDKTDQSVAKGDRARVTLKLTKETASDKFHFGLKADYQADGASGWSHLWTPEEEEQLVSVMETPIGIWFTLHVSLIAGHANTGHVTVHLIDGSNNTTLLFDKAGATIYPENTQDPQSGVHGFTAINPIKLYTAGNYVCWPKKEYALPLDAWWDEFSLAVTPIE